MRYDQPPNRKRLNLTVREDTVSEAKALGLNVSRAAEAGIEAAVKAEKERLWLKDNADAIRAHNERIEREGTFFTPHWDKDD
ncbi:type II toxin-antitoxin system CcdA family antitoxin [Maricaulis sp. CAU 1757]